MDPYSRASQFFGGAFNAMERASDNQARMQGVGMDDARYSADYTPSYMQGAVPPQMGPYGEDRSPQSMGLESFKQELLDNAKKNRRPVNGTTSVRAGGGINTAVMS